MIGKSFLGESLNFLIGKLKLSYKRIFPIIGESLAEVRSGLRRGGLVGIFIAGYAMKSLIDLGIETPPLHKK
ncbi:chromosome partitioning protein ParB [Alloprevotella tannerae]|uniref:chromosome partitioning protein ParB n=1 Tax=Alloprevotella tannerae TaxID=76122 RepID=UPI0025F7DE43|nr:chromosome partitioning protein ParB [Alloprevotella tannerae]